MGLALREMGSSKQQIKQITHASKHCRVKKASQRIRTTPKWLSPEKFELNAGNCKASQQSVETKPLLSTDHFKSASTRVSLRDRSNRSSIGSRPCEPSLIAKCSWLVEGGTAVVNTFAAAAHSQARAAIDTSGLLTDEARQIATFALRAGVKRSWGLTAAPPVSFPADSIKCHTSSLADDTSANIAMEAEQQFPGRPDDPLALYLSPEGLSTEYASDTSDITRNADDKVTVHFFNRHESTRDSVANISASSSASPDVADGLEDQPLSSRQFSHDLDDQETSQQHCATDF